jgi:16S rRNA (cytosine1402-N4)-methyltransferase
VTLPKTKIKTKMKQDPPNDNHHTPVLLESVLQYLDPKPQNSYLDLTAGYGGHAQAVLSITDCFDKSVFVDRDEQAIAALQPFAARGSQLIHQDFLTASRQLWQQGKRFDLVLADLGVSSPHLDKASRGFSILSDAPLDMRMDTRQDLTADTVVNSYDEAELSDVLWRYGEEPKARQIARLIVANRPITNTTQLAKIVSRAWPGHSKTHPATRTFQAIRIAVNDELGLLEQAVPLWIDLLAPDGRLAVISFHSLEDRIVKRVFAERSDGYEADISLLTKRPVTAQPDELVFNPRSRSAKLRVAVKINTKKKGV